jgi:peptidoglycan/xylan/chitin deacetylase (PgdA/CDA1 family)
MMRLPGLLRGATFLAAVLVCGPFAGPALVGAAAADRRIAVTIDDLPWNGSTSPGESVTEATRRLLSTLVSRNVPAVGFVNCARTSADDPLLREWRRAGMELGNHGSHHLNLDAVDAAAWVEDARSCHRILASAIGGAVRFFRFPYLHQGATEARRATAAEGLRDMGYATAHVTIDNSEWILADAYGRALTRGDSDRRAAIAAAYVEHLSAALEHFTAVARSVAGRDVAHVLLLHANALAADHLGRVLDDFRAGGVAFVSLSEVLADPIYGQRDRYVGPKGLSWLYRVDPDGTWAAQMWDGEQAARIEQRFGQ